MLPVSYFSVCSMALCLQDYWDTTGKLIGSLHIHASHTWLLLHLLLAADATVTRYQASLRSPHNALHSPSWGERSEAPNGRYICDFPYIRDRGSDLYVGIDMVKNYCLYKWYGRCSAKKGQKLSQITPN